jgi:hypothetical protein
MTLEPHKNFKRQLKIKETVKKKRYIRLQMSKTRHFDLSPSNYTKLEPLSL